MKKLLFTTISLFALLSNCYAQDIKPLNLKENLIGVKNKFGDASFNNVYELYDNENLVLTLQKSDNMVETNKVYTIRDVSPDNGFKKLNDAYFYMENINYTYEFNKFVISKVIKFNIETDLKYQVILKSNDELYEEVDKDTKMIKLPYGDYIMKSIDNTYSLDISVKDEEEELIEITKEVIEDNHDSDIDTDSDKENNNTQDDTQDNKEQNTTDDSVDKNNQNDNKQDNKQDTVNDKQEELDKSNKEEQKENHLEESDSIKVDPPRTYDNIVLMLWLFSLSAVISFLCLKKLKLINSFN